MITSSVHLSAALVSALAIIQATPDMTGFVGPIERLTLNGVLILAVWALWNGNAKERDAYRKIIAEKDAAILAMATELAKVMTSVLDAVRESRKSSDELGAAVDNLADNVAALGVSPPK